MRPRLLFIVLLATLVGACQAMPNGFFVVVTATPDPSEIALNLTRDAAVTMVAQLQPAAPTEAPTQVLPTPEPTNAAALEPTPLPAGFPTPVVAQITVAEQLFEGGRMFWIQPTGQIWVMVITSEGRGTWTIYEDTFVEGEPETDPALAPPEGRYQPERGFGKLWRQAENLRSVLGWGVTPEFGYVSQYEYHAGGSVDSATGSYTPGPGYHIVFSLGGELFRFNEADGTWQLGND
ncbi:MAG: hypothetical protein JNL42_22990 [Anaerolineae bacterium]|nr:hypothetical protein [Anaerolineae bacterium]